MQVMAQLRGELPLPWEGAEKSAVARQGDVLRGPVMRLLARNPAARMSMTQFRAACEHPFAGDGAYTAGCPV